MTQFVFPAQAERFFEWPVTLTPPGGESQRFTARFVEIGQDGLDAVASASAADEALLKRVLVDWKGVVDDAGEAVAFSAERRDRLTRVPWARYAVAKAYYEAIFGGGRDRGN